MLVSNGSFLHRREQQKHVITKTVIIFIDVPCLNPESKTTEMFVLCRANVTTHSINVSFRFILELRPDIPEFGVCNF